MTQMRAVDPTVAGQPSARGEVIAAMAFVNFATALLFGCFSLLTAGMAASLQIPDSQRGLLFGISGIGAAPGWLLAAFLLKWMSRKRGLLLALAVECMALAVLASATRWELALSALFLIGLAQCSALSAALATAFDVNPPSAVGNLNLVASSNLLFPIAAWGVGAWLTAAADAAAWRPVVWLLLVPLVLCIVWVSRLRLPDPPRKSHPESSIAKEVLNLLAVAFSRPLLLVFVMSGFILGIAPMAWIALFADAVFHDHAHVATATSLTLLGIGLGQLAAGAFTRRYPVRIPLAIAATVLAISYSSLWLTAAPWNCWLVCAASGFLGGMMLPTTLAVAQRNLDRAASDGVAAFGACGEFSAAVAVYLLGVASAIIGLSSAYAFLAICAGVIAVVSLTAGDVFKNRGSSHEVV